MLQGESDKLPRRELIAWALIALAPAIFALASWNPYNPANPVLNSIRYWALPVVAVEVAVIGLAMGSGFAPLARLRALPIRARIALALVVGIAFGTALLVAGAKLLALNHAVIWTIHLLFGFAMFHLAERSTPGVRARFWPAVVAGLLAYVLVLALYVAAIPDPGSFNWLLFKLAGTNIRHVGYFAATGAAAALGLALVQRRPLPAAAAFISAALFFALAIWSGSRGSVVAVWAAFGAGWLCFASLRSIRSVSMLLGSTVLGLVLSLVHQVPNGHFGALRINHSLSSIEDVSSGRFAMWRGTWEAILDRPLFGHGQAQFRNVVAEAQSNFNHPHNGLLQALFDWGFVGGGCCAALLLYLCWRCLDLVRHDLDRQLAAFMVASALLVMALYDGTLFYNYPVMMVAVSLAWIMGTAQGRGELR